MVGAGGNDADRRASEREEIEFLAASESHFPPHTSFPTDRHLPFLHKFEHEKSLSWFPHNIQPQNPLQKWPFHLAERPGEQKIIYSRFMYL